MRKLLFVLIVQLLFLCQQTFAQDTLDSIAKVQTMVQIEEFNLILELGLDSSENYSEKLDSMAKSGNPAAQNKLSICYIDGLGIPKDDKKAFFWATKAAENGNLKALHLLGFCYENGKGTEPDPFQAFSFYKIAALRGMPTAFNDLAQCYLNGTGTPVDSIKARAWFVKGAETGIRTSQTNAGYLYIALEGHENYEKAFYWLSKASEQNSPNALEMLGMCYENGWGTEVNLPKAQECYRKSYQLGNEYAKSRIK